MSEPGLEQETDQVPLRLIAAGIGATVLITVACIIYVAVLLPNRVGDVRRISPAAPAVDQTQYARGAGFAAPRIAAQRARLESYGWIDRAQGIVHVPIARAMELVAGGKPPMTIFPVLVLLFADLGAPPPVVGVDVVEHLGARIPLDVELVNAQDAPVRLGDLVADGRPVILTLAYYRCPMLCDLVLRGVADGLHDLDWKLGRDFRAVTVSIDERDTWADAGRKQATALAAAGAEGGWTFLTGRARETRRLADALGFQYVWDPATQQFAHPAVVFLLAPDGRITRYLYGVSFPPRQLKLALMDASHGKLGSFLDKVIMTCFHWDPATRRYGVFVAGFLRAGAGVILCAVIGMLLLLWRLERRKARVG